MAMSDVLRGVNEIGPTYPTFTDKINKAFNNSGQAYQGNFGWEAIVYER
jgi:hypothetical protein